MKNQIILFDINLFLFFIPLLSNSFFSNNSFFIFESNADFNVNTREVFDSIYFFNSFIVIVFPKVLFEFKLLELLLPNIPLFLFIQAFLRNPNTIISSFSLVTSSALFTNKIILLSSFPFSLTVCSIFIAFFNDKFNKVDENTLPMSDASNPLYLFSII